MTEQDSLKIIDVAVPLYIDSTFHYAVPPELASHVTIGMRVLVPFGRRKLTGYVLGSVGASGEEVKEIVAVLDPEPLFTVAELEFFRWAAGYYLHPLGEVIKSALPAGINITSRKQAGQNPDGTAAEEVLTGGKRVKTEIFYRAVVPPPEGTLREKPARVVAFLAAQGETPAGRLRREFEADAALLKRLTEKGFVTAAEREVYRDPFRAEVFQRDTPPVLNSSQASSLARLTELRTGGVSRWNTSARNGSR